MDDTGGQNASDGPTGVEQQRQQDLDTTDGVTLHVTVKGHLCIADVELLDASFRPPCLWRVQLLPVDAASDIINNSYRITKFTSNILQDDYGVAVCQLTLRVMQQDNDPEDGWHLSTIVTQTMLNDKYHIL